MAGGSAKRIKIIMGREGSRSLLKFPRGLLIDIQLRAMLKYFDSVLVVSDDSRLADYCYNVGGCNFIEQRVSGIEGALCSALASSALVGERLVTILYGDIYSEEAMISSHIAKVLKDYEPLITVTRPVVMRGNFLRVTIDPIDQRVTGIGEGPYIFAGLLTIDARILKELICNEGRSFHDAIDYIARKDLKADVWIGEWVDLDTPWDYLLAVRLDLEKIKSVIIEKDAEVASTAVIEGPAYIAAKARIDHYAVIKGPVYIGHGALVGAHSFLRDHVSLFDSAIAGAYTEIKRSIIYTSAKIGSHSYIADSIVGAAASLAPYTVTLNIPYGEISDEIKLTSTQPLEALKIGAVIPAKTRTRPHDVIEPATIYSEQG